MLTTTRIGAASGKLALLRSEALPELERSILKFWLEAAPDPARGGFFGSIDAKGRPHPGHQRSLVLNARILWAFSASSIVIENARYLDAARRAFEYLADRFWDKRDGGFFWMVRADGRPKDRSKNLYGQAFGLYALSEYFRATRDARALALMRELFGLIEEKCKDPCHPGYFEDFDARWRRTRPNREILPRPGTVKSMNSHLHLMEALTTLYSVWPEERVRSSLGSCVNLLLNQVMNASRTHFRLYFTEDWTAKGEAYSYGHDIEGAWLLREAAEALEPRVREEIDGIVGRIAAGTAAEALDPSGFLSNEGLGGSVSDPSLIWWVQAEAMVGFLYAHRVTADERYLDLVLGIWEGIKAHFVDRSVGEWHYGLTPKLAPLPGRPKASEWKCPYHNSRALLKLWALSGGAEAVPVRA